jgi:hypothetical protein
VEQRNKNQGAACKKWACTLASGILFAKYNSLVNYYELIHIEMYWG